MPLAGLSIWALPSAEPDPMRLRAVALALALLLPLSACSDDGTGPDEDGVHGSYTLRTISGGSLPFTLLDDSFERIEVMEGEIVLRSDGTFTDDILYRVTPVGGVSGPETERFTGRFTQNVGSITFQPTGSGTYQVTIVASGTLSQQVGNYTLLYEK